MLDFFSIELEDAARRFPTLARFASDVGVSVATLRRWATDKDRDGNLINPDFALAFDHAKGLQFDLALNLGLQGRAPHRFVAMLMANLFGWRNQTKQRIETNVMTSKEDLDAIYERGIAASNRR